MSKEIAELHGLRGIAALMVMVWHYTGCLFTPEFGPWTPYFFKVVVFGRTGVDLFLVLSGFLIIGILIDNRDSPNLLKAFYLRRVARILPAYFVLVAVNFIGLAITGPNRLFNTNYGWTQFLLLTNWPFGITGDVTDTLDITWTVALEEQFYLVFPLVVLATPVRRLPVVLITVAAASIVGRALMWKLYPSLPLAPYTWTPFRLDALCIGGLVAIWWRGGCKGDATFLGRAFLALAFIGVPFLVYKMSRGLYGNHMYNWGHTFLACFYALALMVILSKIKSGAGIQILRSQPLVYAGTLSYGIYLCHGLVLTFFFFLADRSDQIANRYDFCLMLLAIPATWIVCELSYRLIENPIRRWGHKFSYSDARQARAAGWQMENVSTAARAN